ncbi:D-aspartate oxidase-like [Toxorhynchites rutilus septentrionalis]|uniref:D-aspartate oxidase-like n=1 Tax=Toxorhynchites rutilus septentrionalis TaxID=329112 RepID=UPI00247AD032|nr:D-aspartate oxidase-like [Toxorhynchites rutilus septentrionalis]
MSAHVSSLSIINKSGEFISKHSTDYKVGPVKSLDMKQIIVLGAGVNGLCAAVQLAEHYYNVTNVTLISEEISPNTTGDGSAGLWGPYYCGKTPEHKIVKWSSDTHAFFHQLWKNGLASRIGISLQPCFRLTTDPKGYPEPTWKDNVFGCTKISQAELKRISQEHGRQYTGGYQFATFTCEPAGLLPYLFNRFLAVGGKFVQSKVDSIEGMLKGRKADLIVNCTGLGSLALFGDNEVLPIRGQVARVCAPWVFEIILDDSDDGNYVIPNTETVILGGTHQMNDFNRNVNAKDSKFIFDGCERMLPSLKNAPKVKEWVGLRPGRSTVRLELEHCEAGKQTVPIIHNYGHGGCGVTLCWGCGSEVLQLSKSLDLTRSAISKL